MQIYFGLLESNYDLLVYSDLSLYLIASLISLKDQEFQAENGSLSPDSIIGLNARTILVNFIERIKICLLGNY